MSLILVKAMGVYLFPICQVIHINDVQFSPCKSQCKKVILNKYKFILKSPFKFWPSYASRKKDVHVLKKKSIKINMVYETNIKSPFLYQGQYLALKIQL